MHSLSHMGKNEYITEAHKFRLLTDTILYIDNHIQPKLADNDLPETKKYFESDAFSHFQTEIQSAKMIVKHNFDIDQAIIHASNAIHSWNFGLQFAIPQGKERAYKPRRYYKFGERLEILWGEDLSDRVTLLRQIIDLFKHHRDDVWMKEVDQGGGGPVCKPYNTPRHKHLIEHEHIATKPHEPKKPESTDPVPLDALLLQLHELSTRDI